MAGNKKEALKENRIASFDNYSWSLNNNAWEISLKNFSYSILTLCEHPSGFENVFFCAIL